MTRRQTIPFFLLAVGVLVLDFVSKRFVLANADSFREGIPLIDGLLRFTYVRNSGAAFGLFQGGRWPFIFVSSLAVVGLSWILWRGRASRLRATAYSLILGGAAGNLIDRVFYGGRVVDFIEMGWQGRTFPVYNFADMGVSIGAALLILAMLVEGHGDHATEVESAETAPPPAGVDAPQPEIPPASHVQREPDA